MPKKQLTKNQKQFILYKLSLDGNSINALLAQLDRASVYGTEG